MKFVFFLLFLFAIPVSAQDVPQKGEIALDGAIASVADDGRSFELEAVSFTLPGGKTARFKAPKRKTVLLSAQSTVAPRGDALWRMAWDEIRVGRAARVMGKDAGSGQALPARQVELVRESGGIRLDYFVSHTGNDAGVGTFEAPWRTVQNAVKRVPSGSAGAPTVLHLGAGEFGESFDGHNAGLVIDGKNHLILSGAGALATGGTQITTRGYLKKRSGVVRVVGSQNITLCNMTIGDDENWEGDAFFEATLHLEAGATVDLHAVWLRGPGMDTLLDGDKGHAPTALHAGNGDAMLRDRECMARLSNVLVTGHGAFLSNPAGQVHCGRVTIARNFGFFRDDSLLFLQTPHEDLRPSRRYTFQNCLFYELAGQDKGRHLWFTSGEQGQDKAFFDPENGGNRVVRCHHEGPNELLNERNLADAFPVLNENGGVRAQGVWPNGDSKAPPLGGLRVDNELHLRARDGFAFVASADSAAGWTGGFWSALDKP